MHDGEFEKLTEYHQPLEINFGKTGQIKAQDTGILFPKQFVFIRFSDISCFGL